nr:hypothetical protein [Clostridioides sp.]
MNSIVITAIYFTCLGIAIGWIGDYILKNKKKRTILHGDYEYIQSKKDKRYTEKGF